MITDQEYASIAKTLSFERKTSITLALLLIDGLLLATALFFLTQESRVLYWLAQPLLAVSFLHSFLILHEAGHHACAKSKAANLFIGHYASIFCCMPFFPWKYIHAEHHKWTGHLDNDPVFDLLKQAKKKKKLPLIMHIGWRTFLPIGVFFLHLVYWSYPIKLAVHKKMNKKIFFHCALSVAILPVSYFFLHKIDPALFKFINFLPAIFIYGILWELLSTPQHIGLPSTLNQPSLKDHANTTRSTQFPKFIEKYLFLNFGLHIEHHFFPGLPWHELKHVQNLIKPLLADEYTQVKGLVWNAKTRSQNIEKFLGIKQ